MARSGSTTARILRAHGCHDRPGRDPADRITLLCLTAPHPFEVTAERGAHLVLVALLFHAILVPCCAVISSPSGRQPSEGAGARARQVRAATPPSTSVGTTVRKR